VCGIPRTRDIDGGVIVRPILGIGKASINDYCAENKIEYVTDSTNADTEYTRNRIRNCVIPELKALCPNAEYAAARLSESLRADALCLDSMAEWFLSEARRGFSIETEKLNGSPSAISTRALMALYSEISEGKTLEYTHVKAITELSLKAVPHSSIDLPGEIRATIEGGALEFTKRPLPPKNIPSESFCENISDSEVRISQINAEIIIGNTQKGKNIYKKSMKLFLDSDKIIGTVYARSREAGDKIKMNGMSKSVKKLMCDKKIAQELRPRIPMICDDSGIIAIPFVGVKDGYASKSETKNILCMEFGLL
jgi:tRNA(Ile)-lysidine synthase